MGPELAGRALIEQHAAANIRAREARGEDVELLSLEHLVNSSLADFVSSRSGLRGIACMTRRKSTRIWIDLTA